VHERGSIDDVAIVVMDDNAVLAVAEEAGPLAVVIGRLNREGVFEEIPFFWFR
jgi:hypothetical protein